MKNICRTCLVERKKLRSIFEYNNEKRPCAEIIMTIANIKVFEGDGHPDKICRTCRNRLMEAYNFVQLIQSCDRRLRGVDYSNTDSKSKKLFFNNFNDIKIEFDFKPDIEVTHGNEEFKINLEDEAAVTLYNDITITRLQIKNEKINDDKALSVEDFLHTIKDEIINNDGGGYASSIGDDEYTPPYKYCKLKRKKRKTTSKVKKNKGVKNGTFSQVKKVTPIRPIIREDIRLIPSKSQESKPRAPRPRYLQKELICSHCGRFTKSMHTHMLTHTGERNFKCTECPKAYYTQAHLDHHKSVHSIEKKFKCDQCVAEFHNKSLLQSHMLSHVEIKKHVCNVCNKGFKRKGTLRKHTIRHSSANKTIKCELCNMSFFEKWQLKHHVRVHTGERPYNCELCSQPYSYKHDFNRHCLKKHGVFLKRRSVNVMNEEVLVKERALIKEVLLRANGVLDDGKPVNPFEGPQAALAYHQTIKALGASQISVLDF